jgi:hypothetical protein
MLYMVTFTINIPQMLAYIPDMDPMGMCKHAEKNRLEPFWTYTMLQDLRTSKISKYGQRKKGSKSVDQ